VDVPVEFSVLATDATLITYTWNFGDGTTTVTTDPDVSHTYLVPGSYAVTVTLTDAGGLSSSAALSFLVAPGNITTALETVYPLQVQLVRERLAFPSSLAKDSVAFKGIIELGDGFNPAGQQVHWQLGGVLGAATLDARAKSGKSSTPKVTLRYKKPKGGLPFTTRRAILSISLRKQDLGLLKLNGVPVLNQTTSGRKGAAAGLDAYVVLTGHRGYAQTNVQGLYKALVDKLGQFSAKFKVKL
jgi:hypothetical protein